MPAHWHAKYSASFPAEVLLCGGQSLLTDDEWEQLLIRWGNTAVGWFVMTDLMSGRPERFDKIGDKMPSMDVSHIISFEASKPSAHCEIGSNFVFSSCVKTCIYLCVFHQGLGCKAAWTPPHHFPPKSRAASSHIRHPGSHNWAISLDSTAPKLRRLILERH